MSCSSWMRWEGRKLTAGTGPVAADRQDSLSNLDGRHQRLNSNIGPKPRGQLKPGCPADFLTTSPSAVASVELPNRPEPSGFVEATPPDRQDGLVSYFLQACSVHPN